MRKLATIQEILEIKPIKGADRIECARVQGWDVVVQKGQFKVSEKCIYFEIDSILPIKSWCKFLEKKDSPGKPVRLKTQRMRGQLSQGLVVPLHILKDYINVDVDYEIGTDLTDILEITKYIPEIPACLQTDAKGARPSYIHKTDKDRIQAFPDLIQEFQGKLVYITQKIDGTSSTFVNMVEEFDCCGRNWSFKYDEKNTYWKICDKYNLKEKLQRIYQETKRNYGVQGECYGEKIQKNRLEIKGQDLKIFDVVNLEGHKYLDFYELKEFCERLSLPMVPVLKICKFEWNSIEELLEEAKGNYESGQIQEGIVITPVHGFHSEVLNGRATFKVINNDFLLKGGD